ncbi:MAG: zinc ribbon domain-containing protein [Acidobacteria bacterium]|nr:zinc ribbon domain-containing protein [Acidobacteriota bacterium]
MAFCNSCGATLETGTKFCSKCGAAVPLTAATAPPPVQGQGSSALKIILMVVGALALLFVLGLGAVGFFAWRVAKHSKVENRNGSVHVETPLGTVDSNQDPEEIAQTIGIELYPGARIVKGSAASVTLGSMHTASVALETDDPAEKVAEFYREQLPTANFSGSQNGPYTIVSGDTHNAVTVTILPSGGSTKIQIAKVKR